MKTSKKKKGLSPALQQTLSAMAEKASQKGIQVHFDLLEAAGLRLKGGICKIRNEYHLFIDKRTPAAEKIEMLQDILDNPLPKDIPENIPEETPKGGEREDT